MIVIVLVPGPFYLHFEQFLHLFLDTAEVTAPLDATHQHERAEVGELVTIFEEFGSGQGHAPSLRLSSPHRFILHALAGDVVELAQRAEHDLVVTKERLLRQQHQRDHLLAISHRHETFIRKVQVVKRLACLHNRSAFYEYLAVQLSEDFTDKHFVSEVLVLALGLGL